MNDTIVDHNINLTNEKIRLEADLGRSRKAYDDLEARFNTLQDRYWKVQEKILAMEGLLMNELGVRNANDYSTKIVG
jgi:predicted  nucleic acid-binding Zn-ribbon protein